MPDPAPRGPLAARSAVRRLALARLLSMTGTDASGVAIGFAIYAATGSTALLSLSLLLTIGASAVLAPLGGWLGDRLPRRRLMVGCELAAAALFGLLAFVHDPAVLLAAGFAASAIGALFGPAAGAAIAHVAGPERLTWANGLIASSANVGKTVGRLGAGGLIAVAGTGAVFLFDALTFVASAALIASLSTSLGGRAAAGAAPLGPRRLGRLPRPGRAGGLSLALLDPTIRPVLAAACVSTFATAFSMTAEVPLVFELGGGAVALGALTACWAAGMVAGSWWGGRVLHAGNEVTGVLAGRLLMAAGIGAVTLGATIAPVLLCYALGGLGGGFMGVAAQSLVLRRTPEALRARVLGTMDACRNASFGAGVLLAGVVVAPLGPSATYGLVGLAVALGCLPLAAHVRALGGVRALRPAEA